MSSDQWRGEGKLQDASQLCSKPGNQLEKERQEVLRHYKGGVIAYLLIGSCAEYVERCFITWHGRETKQIKKEAIINCIKDKTWTGRNVFGLYSPWKEHDTFLPPLLHLLAWGPGRWMLLSVWAHTVVPGAEEGHVVHWFINHHLEEAQVLLVFIGQSKSHLTSEWYWGARIYISATCLQGELRHLWAVLVATWLNSEELESDQNTGDSCSTCIRTMEREGIGSGGGQTITCYSRQYKIDM